MRTRSSSSSDPVPSSAADPGPRHIPVLLHEVVKALEIQSGDVVVDATLGGAGHASELVKGLGGNGLFVGFDQDVAAIRRAEAALGDSKVPTHFVSGNFRNIAGELEARNITSITKVLFDLGWSSYQLDSGLPGQGRGFSFLKNEPLLMTYARPSENAKEVILTARAIVNTWDEKTLADVIYGFGEERYARRIAKAIVEARERDPIQTSSGLAEIIRAAVPAAYRRGKIHPATRTFQALRMATNDELGALEDGLNGAWKLLESGGRIAVISFHSVEDRVVKQKFLAWEKSGEGKRLTKKPIVPGRDEVRKNSRARSAKLRVIEKISHEKAHTKNKQIRPFHISGED